MSHTVKAETRITDIALLTQVCKKLGLPDPEPGVHTLYQGQHKGYAVRLPGWNYPVVVDMTTGEAVYDNFNGSWGNQAEMDKLLSSYAHDFVLQDFQRQNGANIQEFVDGEGWVVMECEIATGMSAL